MKSLANSTTIEDFNRINPNYYIIIEFGDGRYGNLLIVNRNTASVVEVLEDVYLVDIPYLSTLPKQVVENYN